jgi:hypothetical protein
MIKVTTASETVYIIDKEQGRIKRIPRAGTTFESVLRGFVNVGEFQPYNFLQGLEIGSILQVEYPHEQNWSRSTTITEIDEDFEDNKDD